MKSTEIKKNNLKNKHLAKKQIALAATALVIGASVMASPPTTEYVTGLTVANTSTTDGYQIEAYSNLYPVAQAVNNSLSNVVNVGAGYLAVSAYGEDGHYGSAYGAYSANSGVTTSVVGNRVLNTGSITNDFNFGGDFFNQDGGIELISSSNALTDISGFSTNDPVSSAGESVATSLVSGNTVTNSGPITAWGEDAAAIALGAVSIAESTVSVRGSYTTTPQVGVTDIYLGSNTNADSDSYVSSLVTSNTITNNGNIFGEDNGITLYATSLSRASTEARNIYGEDSPIRATSTASSSVVGNNITNNGAITSDVDGIELSAVAGAVATIGVDATHLYDEGNITYTPRFGEMNTTSLAISANTGNTVINNKTIVTESDGILLESSADAFSSQLNGIISSNFPSSPQDQASASGTQTMGILNFGDYEYSTNILASATSNVDSNVITNMGSIDVVSDGIELDSNAYAETNNEAYSEVSNIQSNNGYSAFNDVQSRDVRSSSWASTGINSSATANSTINNNIITNNGLITTSDDDGIVLTGSAAADADNYGDSFTVSQTTAQNLTSAPGHNLGDMYNEASAQGYAWIANSASSTSEINNNQVINRGKITVDDMGIYLNSSAESDTYNTGDATAEIKAYATSTANNYDDGEGDYRIHNSQALATVGLDNEGVNSQIVNTSTSMATASNNLIKNYGTIVSGDDGIRISADSNSYAENEGSAVAFGDIEARSFSWNDAVNESDANGYLTAEVINTATSTTTVSENTVLNAGLINSGSIGISVYADAVAEARNYGDATVNFDEYAFGEYNSTNTDTDVDGYAKVLNQATSLAQITNNTITNFGKVIAVDDGINVSANAVSRVYGYSYVDFDSADGFNDGNDTSNLSEDTLAELNAQNGNLRGGDYSNATAKVDSNTIINYGSITSIDGNGIYLSAYAEAYGEDSEQSTTSLAYIRNNNIRNGGSILAKDVGIYLRANNDYDTDVGADGSFVDNNTVINTGRIVAGNVGIRLLSENDGDYDMSVTGNKITNSGVIITDPGLSISDSGKLTRSSREDFDATEGVNLGKAIEILGVDYSSNEEPDVNVNYDYALDGNQLNLKAPGYLAGQIILDTRSNTTVNLISGASHSVRWAIQDSEDYSPSSVTMAGAVPWFSSSIESDVDGEANRVFATIDPTALSAAPNMLADLTSSISTISRMGLGQNSDKYRSGLWAAVQGGMTKHDGNKSSTLPHSTNLTTGVLGYNSTLRDSKLGFVLGVYETNLDVNSVYSDLYSESYKNKVSGGYLGARLLNDKSAVNYDLSLTIGTGRHTDDRFVNDNLTWWGSSKAKASYNSYWISPELGVSVPFQVSTLWTVSPNVRVSYSFQKNDSYREYGSNSDASFDSATFGVVQSTAGFDFIRNTEKWKVNLGAGYLNRSLVGDKSVSVTMLGQTQDLPYNYSTISAAYVKGSVNYSITPQTDVILSGSYLEGSLIKSGNVNLLMRYKY